MFVSSSDDGDTTLSVVGVTLAPVSTDDRTYREEGARPKYPIWEINDTSRYVHT